MIECYNDNGLEMFRTDLFVNIFVYKILSTQSLSKKFVGECKQSKIQRLLCISARKFIKQIAMPVKIVIIMFILQTS